MKRLLLITFTVLTIIQAQAQGWGQTQKIVPDDRFGGQQFGADVAIDGNYAVIGVLVSGFARDAYVYENDGTGNWIQIQKLQSPNFNQFDHFGTAVAISGDYIFIGAWGQDYDAADSNYLDSSGAVYVFKKLASGLFEFEQKIVASDREALNAFGYSIAVDGNYAVVSPVRHDYDAEGNNFLNDAGTAYIFEKDETGTWIEVQKIVASDRAVQDFFGQTALAVGGNYIAVGSYADDEDENGINTIPSAGSAYIFERDNNGTWNEVQKIVASDRAQGEFFGWSIGLDGNQLVVGSNQNNNFTGAAYVFEKNGNNIWNEVQKLTASFAFTQFRFGQDVDIDEDRAVIGAYATNIGSVSGGAAFVFEKDISGIWNETAVMYDPEASSGDFFGFSVAISDDFSLVGAYQEDQDENNENTILYAGSTYIFNVNEPNTLDPLSTLSVVENNLDLIKVFPNPTTGEVIINLKSSQNNIVISILNNLGQEVLYKTFSAISEINLNLEHLKTGIYFIKLNTDTTKNQNFKIIKN